MKKRKGQHTCRVQRNSNFFQTGNCMFPMLCMRPQVLSCQDPESLVYSRHWYKGLAKMSMAIYIGKYYTKSNFLPFFFENSIFCFGQPPSTATLVTRGITNDASIFLTGSPGRSPTGFLPRHTPYPRRPAAPAVVVSCRHPALKYSAAHTVHFAVFLKATQTN